MAGESSLIFITGGVRSGKSSFAEKLSADLAGKTGGNLHYIAAGQANDPEMEARIRRHQEDRRKSGLCWTTWEKPSGLAEMFAVFDRNDIVVLDCLTTLLNNELFLAEDLWRERRFQEKVSTDILQGIDRIRQRCKAIIIVSNEVLNEPIGRNKLVFTYGKILGRLHQTITAMADQAYLVEAGLKVQMKGEPV